MHRLSIITEGIVSILVPMALIGLGVRLLLTPMYLAFEYRLPGFPPDDYGFSTEERLHWGAFGIEYLVNDEPASFLADLQFEDGRPLFTARELSHMQDVKGVMGRLLGAWYIVLATLALSAIWAWRAGWAASYVHGLRRGGGFTLILAVLAGVIGSLGALGSGEIFWDFFATFHGLFFRGDSWLFAYSDTLIRLYPLRFWQDSVVYIGILAAAGGAALAFGLRRLPAS